MFDRILVVCTGNICRSPLAMAMLKQRLPEKQIESAGIGALVDKGADDSIMELAASNGLDLSEHKARQLNHLMLQKADLILVMTEDQRQAVSEKLPEATGKTMLFGQWLQNRESGKQGMDIPDPYRKSREAFDYVYELLSEAANTWQSRL
ncbi:MAG: low molecular weight protein-tyrosine-phosphatase [Pseudohongiellaceae bacterium]